MLYSIGVGHSVQVDRKGDFPETEKFKKYLESKIKELRITLIGEEFSKETLSFPYNDIPSTTTQDIAKKLSIEHRFCDPDTEQRKAIGWRSKKDDDKRRRFWLECIKDKAGEEIIFVCGCRHLKAFTLLLTRNRLEANILPRRFVSQIDRIVDEEVNANN